MDGSKQQQTGANNMPHIAGAAGSRQSAGSGSRSAPDAVPRNQGVVLAELAGEVAAGSRVEEVGEVTRASPDPSQVRLPVDALHKHSLGDSFVVGGVAGVHLQSPTGRRGCEGAATAVNRPGRSCQDCQGVAAVRGKLKCRQGGRPAYFCCCCALPSAALPLLAP